MRFLHGMESRLVVGTALAFSPLAIPLEQWSSAVVDLHLSLSHSVALLALLARLQHELPY